VTKLLSSLFLFSLYHHTARTSITSSKNSKKLRTQIYMDLRYIDPKARVLNYFYK